MKVDLFPLSDDPLDVRQLERRVLVEVAAGVAVWVGAPDDQILRKLRWFRLGGEVSERQWRDVVSILVVQGARVDHKQLMLDAEQLGLAVVPGDGGAGIERDRRRGVTRGWTERVGGPSTVTPARVRCRLDRRDRARVPRCHTSGSDYLNNRYHDPTPRVRARSPAESPSGLVELGFVEGAVFRLPVGDDSA